MINSLLPGMLVAVCMKKLCLYLQIYSFIQNVQDVKYVCNTYVSKGILTKFICQKNYVVKFLSTIITC